MSPRLNCWPRNVSRHEVNQKNLSKPALEKPSKGWLESLTYFRAGVYHILGPVRADGGRAFSILPLLHSHKIPFFIGFHT
jgi:hypothetical protein